MTAKRILIAARIDLALSSATVATFMHDRGLATSPL
jgi:hypothetical protein